MGTMGRPMHLLLVVPAPYHAVYQVLSFFSAEIHLSLLVQAAKLLVALCVIPGFSWPPLQLIVRSNTLQGCVKNPCTEMLISCNCHSLQIVLLCCGNHRVGGILQLW